MKFIFDTKYSETELEFLSRHNCKMISEIKLSKMDLSEHEIPRRMFKYGSEYIGEILDDESNKLVSVSYTHLDVYKRQLFSSIFLISAYL